MEQEVMKKQRVIMELKVISRQWYECQDYEGTSVNGVISEKETRSDKKASSDEGARINGRNKNENRAKYDKKLWVIIKEKVIKEPGAIKNHEL